MPDTHDPEPTPWGPLPLVPDEPLTVRAGTLRGTLKRHRGELWVRTARGEGPDSEWDRWSVDDEATVFARPAPPDRLLVVSHEHPFHLPRRRQARVFVRVPLFLKLVVRDPGGDELVLLDAPSLVLSDTWWGTVQEGELAYWLSTKARAEVKPDIFLPHLAICPVQFENQSDEALLVDKFAVQAIHLSLFRNEERTWTDEVRVRYLAPAEGSEIRMAGEPPAEDPEAERIAEPRVSIRRGLQARTFDRLRSLTTLGGQV